MKTSGWFQCFSSDVTAGAGVRNAVENCGVELCDRGVDEADGDGMVVFDLVDDRLCAALERDSDRGMNRIVAVALTSVSLGVGAAWRLLAAGAADVFAWDAMPDPAATVAAHFDRYTRVDELIHSPTVSQELAGDSPAWTAVLRQVVEVAAFSAASVLITGESGTGKELIARLIHALDRRPNKGRFVVLDCTTVSAELAGSEFFGHERGAFTTAVAAREGAFALAEGGSLFLDEVGELPLSLQAELLRVVQERQYKRVGGNVWKQADFRLICATNRDLREEEARGAFRRDFYHRIASWTCALPALAERREDILPLTYYFLRQMFAGGAAPRLDAPVRDYLLTREYPGNVRELRQLLVRMVSRHVGAGPLTVGDLSPDEQRLAAGRMQKVWHDGAFECAIRRALAMGLGLKEINSQTADVAIRAALTDEDGNLRRAARRLGVTDRALQMRRAIRRRNGRASGISDESRFNASEAQEQQPTDPVRED